MSEKREIKVLIVEDSALTRAVLEKVINASEELKVVGSAMNPLIAIRKIESLKPDVITLDLIMPDMDGLTFLKRVRKSTDIPVVVISGNSPKASKNAIKALELGALDVIEKPDVSSPAKLQEVSSVIHESIIAAHSSKRTNEPAISFDFNFTKRSKKTVSLKASSKFYVIGSSTGGPELLKSMFSRLDSGTQGIVVAQHMPEAFTQSFAERLDCESDIEVKHAKDGDRIVDGRAYIIPGNYHGEVKADHNGYYIRINQDDKVNRHRPSVNVLFNSAAAIGNNSTGIILTGMGNDGASGMLKMREQGATTIAQDEASSVVYGMPKQAVELGAAEYSMSPIEIVKYMNKNVKK